MVLGLDIHSADHFNAIRNQVLVKMLTDEPTGTTNNSFLNLETYECTAPCELNRSS